MAQSQYDYSYRLRQELHRRIRRVAFFIAAVLVCLILFLRFVLFSVSVHTATMQPGTAPGAMLFVSPLFTTDGSRDFFTLKRGDAVLVFPHRQETSPFFSRMMDGIVSFITFQKITVFAKKSVADSAFLSRILGFPGDTMYMTDYVLYVKPAGAEHFLSEFELTGNDYEIFVSTLPKDWDNTIGISGSFSELKLDDDEYFLLCDNRTSSADSRIWGHVEGSQIHGKAVFRYFPFRTVSLL
jgi:signal peptidase I